MCAAIRSATRRREDRIGVGEEHERRLLPAARGRSRTRRSVPACRMLGRDRHELGEGEDAGLRLRHGPGSAVGLLDLVAHRLRRTRCGRACPGSRSGRRGGRRRGSGATRPTAAGRRRCRCSSRRAARRARGARRRAGGRSGRPSPGRRPSGRAGPAPRRAARSSRVEVVACSPRAERLVRAAEAEVVGRDRARGRRQLGDHRAVEVRPGRLAVQEEHGRALRPRRGSASAGRPAPRSAAGSRSPAGPRTARRACGRRPAAALLRRLVLEDVEAEVAVAGEHVLLPVAMLVDLDAPEVVAALVDEGADLLSPSVPYFRTRKPPA